jgi:hypothetical protein
MSNPIVTVEVPSLTMTIVVAPSSIIVVDRWYVQPEPGGDGGGWLFNLAANSSHAMLTW